MMPLITIGIPSFNSKDTIERAIRSALGQSYSPIEVIVVDDASSDGSQEFLRALAGKLPIKVILLETNAGVANACNTVIRECQGEYIAFLGDDDEFTPDKISKQYEILKKNPGMAASFTARTQVFSNGTKVYEPAVFTSAGNEVSGDDLIEWGILGRYGSKVSGSAGSGTCLAHRSVYQKLSGYDVNFRRSSDMEFVVRFGMAGGKALSIQEPLLIQHMTSGADKNVERQKKFQGMMIEKHRSYLSSRGLLKPARAFFEIKFHILQGQKWSAALEAIKLLFVSPVSLWRAMRVGISRRKIIASRKTLMGQD